MLGELDEAHASGTRALAIARKLGDLELQILSTTLLGQVLHYRGEYEQQAALIRENVSAMPWYLRRTFSKTQALHMPHCRS